MKKKGRKRIDGNVILFPNLEKRLLDRGLEQLQEKKFSEAIQLFEEAKALAPEDSDIYIGLVLAYYEAGALQNAKQLAKEMLKEDIGDYVQTVDLYLMILVQLHEYDEIITTIEVLEEEREIPLDKQEHFSKLLTFSKRMADARTFSEFEEEDEDLLDFDEPVNFSLDGDPNKQVLAIAELAHKNVRPYINEVKNFLKSKDGHPFLKTMLLNILQEQEYEKEIYIEKFGSEKTVIPTTIVPIRESEQFLEIKRILNPIEDKDPILFQQMLSLLERHMFLISPFDLEPKDPHVWAASYHHIGLEFNGVEMLIDDMAIQYKVELIEIEKACSFIRKLEKISYPII